MLAERERRDQSGDQLGHDVLCRVGTLRLRHGDTVSAVRFSVDGKLLVSVGWDGVVAVWEIPSGRERLWRQVHASQLYAVDVSQNSKQLLVAGQNHYAAMVDAASGEVIQLLSNGNGTDILSIIFADDDNVILTGDDRGSVCIWQAHDYTLLDRFETGDDAIRNITYSSEARLIALATTTSVEVRDVDTWKRLHYWPQPLPAWVEFDAIGRTLVVASGDAEGNLSSPIPSIVRWHNLTSGRIEHEVSNLPPGCTAAVVSPNSAVQIACQWHVYEVHRDEGRCSDRFNYDNFIFTADKSRDGEFLAVAGNRAAIALLPQKDNIDLSTDSGHLDAIGDAQFSRDGSQLVTASYDGTVRLWDAACGVSLKRRSLGGRRASLLAMAPSTERCAVTVGQLNPAPNRISVWDFQSDHVFDLLDIVNEADSAIKTSPEALCFLDDHRLLLACDDGSVRQINIVTGSTETVLRCGVEPNCRFAPRKHQFVTYHQQGATVALYDVAAGKKVSEFDSGCREPFGLAVLPNAEMVACCDASGALLVFQNDGRRIAKFEYPFGNAPRCAAFFNDGQRIATGDSDHGVTVWSLQTEKPLFRAVGHRGFIYDIAVSSDNKRFATAATDSTALVWNAPQV